MTSWSIRYALLLALSVTATRANAEPTQWSGFRLDQLALVQSTRLLSAPLLPLAPEQPVATWPSEPVTSSRFRHSELMSPTDAQLAALLARRPTLEYTPRDSSLTLSLEPGSPCTGACLKLVGWF